MQTCFSCLKLPFAHMRFALGQGCLSTRPGGNNQWCYNKLVFSRELQSRRHAHRPGVSLAPRQPARIRLLGRAVTQAPALKCFKAKPQKKTKEGGHGCTYHEDEDCPRPMTLRPHACRHADIHGVSLGESS